MNHLAIYNQHLFGKDYIALMLSGERSLGLKFLVRKTVPYEKLHEGDVVYLKEASGPVRGRVTVHSVHNIVLSDPEQVMEFLVAHAYEIGIEDNQMADVWRKYAASRYLCWWRMDLPQSCAPTYIMKRDRRVWVADFAVPEELAVAFL